MRDADGKMIYAFDIPLGTGTNNQAEAQAVIHGLHWSIQHGFKMINLEVDSKMLTKWINHTSKPPWRMQHDIQELGELIKKLSFF